MGLCPQVILDRIFLKPKKSMAPKKKRGERRVKVDRHFFGHFDALVSFI